MATFSFDADKVHIVVDTAGTQRTFTKKDDKIAVHNYKSGAEVYVTGVYFDYGNEVNESMYMLTSTAARSFLLTTKLTQKINGRPVADGCTGAQFRYLNLFVDDGNTFSQF